MVTVVTKNKGKEKDKYASWITELGKEGDLMYHLTGGDEGKYHKVMNEQLPRAVNKGASKIVEPFAKVDKKINPLRKIELYDKIATESETRPGDTAAAILGTMFGGSALMGAGSTAAGGTAGASTTAGTTASTSSGFAGMSGAEWAKMGAKTTAKQLIAQQQAEAQAKQAAMQGAHQSALNQVSNPTMSSTNYTPEDGYYDSDIDLDGQILGTTKKKKQPLDGTLTGLSGLGGMDNEFNA